MVKRLVYYCCCYGCSTRRLPLLGHFQPARQGLFFLLQLGDRGYEAGLSLPVLLLLLTADT